MRIDLVAVVNFGSHAAKVWEPGDARLTVVTGPNGVGKSTLLVDAPCFALSGEVPGGYSPDQLVRTGATDMSVILEFTLDGQRYRFVRRRTTRAGGKSSADAQVLLADGTWRPLASGAREVSAEAVRLLRMDQHTFRTAVVLAQGDAKRFMDATPGKGTPQAPGRAAILSTLVVDPVFALAEAKAREEARELEATTAADRGQVERVGDAIAELAGAPGLVAERRAEISGLETAIAVDRARRGEITERLTALAGEIAKGDAAAAEVARLEEERAALADRYRREKATVATSDEARLAATAALAAADAVERAAADIPAAQAEVAGLEVAEADARRLRDEVAAKRQAMAEIERPFEQAAATWAAEHTAAERRITELIAAKNGLQPVICEKCGTANIVDQADVRGQLATARARLAELDNSRTVEPMAIARDKAALVRLESKLREIDLPDPSVLSAARAQLATLERSAARAGEISAARAALTAAAAAKVSAEAELVSIEKAGKVIAVRIEAARDAKAAAVALLEEQVRLTADARALDDSMDVDGRRLRELERVLANAEAQLERLEQLIAERDALTAKLAGADVDLARLRRLVAAFGVKGIPARVIESVLPELVEHANELLGQLRPGMTLDLRASRAKADGSGTIEALDIWIRDHRGERQRWSGGEGTSIAMSIAVALSRLGARRSGARISTLVIDEPDGLDGESRRAFGQALRVLAHRGDLERVAVITHQDGIPDFADDVVELEPVIESFDSIGLVA